MRAAVVSDVHGNRHAFQAVLDEILAEDFDAIWCLGDLVGYGAEPDACVELTRAHAKIVLAGNHDLAVRGDLPLESFSRGAELAARWTQEVIGEDSLQYLYSLKPKAEDGGDIGLFHASPRDPVWEYVLSALQAEMCLDVQRPRIGLIGHSHVALSFHRSPGAAATGETRPAGSVLDLAEGEWLVNPGSVGQPRDGDWRAAWLELDVGAWTARYRRTAYDVAAAGAAIRAARLPDSLAERLRYGQ